MPYATQQDMLERFGADELRQLTDINEPRLDGVDAAVLGKALADAAALIDGYLVGRYPLPLQEPPAVLTVHCAGVARYLLMRYTPDERAKADFEAAMTYLNAVATGKIGLLPPASAPALEGIGTVVFNAGQKTFAREAAEG